MGPQGSQGPHECLANLKGWVALKDVIFSGKIQENHQNIRVTYYISISISISIYNYIYIYLYIYMCVCVCVYVYIYIYICVCV